jgi:hypothetical protein
MPKKPIKNAAVIITGNIKLPITKREMNRIDAPIIFFEAGAK